MKEPSMVRERGRLRFWLCALVIATYFATYGALLAIVRSGAEPSSIPVLLTVLCMGVSIGSTALFVVLLRDAR